MKHFLSILFTLVALFTFAFTPFAANGVLAYGAVTSNFDQNPVEDDLADLNTLEYPYNAFGTADVISVMEYGYSDRMYLSDIFNLYIYVYNPTQRPLRTTALANTVTISSAFDENGIPTDYRSYALAVCDVSENMRFYKFKLTNPAVQLSMQRSYAAQFDGVRRYDISSVQIWYQDDESAADIAVDTTYRYSGYAQGCSDESENAGTLVCDTTDLLNVDIPLIHTNDAGEEIVQQTYYRTGTSSLGEGHRWQIDSVYFSVDEAELEEQAGWEFGQLQKIKAQWYEYQTKPIFITSSDQLDVAFSPYVGIDISGYSDEQLRSLGYGFGKYDHFDMSMTGSGALSRAFYDFFWDFGYGLFQGIDYSNELFDFTNTVEQELTQIDWWFRVDDAGSVTITSQELWAYARAYALQFGVSENDLMLQELGLNDAQFTDTIATHAGDGEFHRGYNEFEFDADSRFDLRDYDSTLSGWDRFWNNLFGSVPDSSWDIPSFSPIEQITVSDLMLSNEQLLINDDDAADFRTWAQEEISEGKSVYLFRYAVTDYTEYSLSVSDYMVMENDSVSPIPTLASYPISMAQEAVFLGFEMITLTYNHDGNLTVLAVVQDPIHIMNDVEVELADDGIGLWEMILTIIGLILLVVILWPLLPYIAKLIVFVISLPVKLIQWIIKTVKKE